MVWNQGLIGLFNMKINLIHLLLILLIWSCSQPELELDNQFDPDNPDYIAPETTILYTNPPLSEDNVLNVNMNVGIYWEGNDPEMEFQSKMDNGDWSNWSEVPFGNFNYLNEGFHRLLVRGRYLSGTEEETPDTLEFTVDKIGNSSLWIKDYYTKVSNQDTFSVDVMAENFPPIAGAGILIRFNGTKLELDSTIIKDFFGEDPIYFDSLNTSSANYNLQIDIATYGDINFIQDSGIIATLYFKAKSSGEHEIKFIEETTLRDENNNVIEVIQFQEGIVEVQ
mgnify:CR=1 FL=1